VSENLKNQIIWDDFRRGSKKALETIYEDHYGSLYHYGMKFCKDQDLVKDLIQELFIELIDSGSKLSQTDNIRFYLLRALRNKLVKQLSEKSKFSASVQVASDFDLIDSIESQLIIRETEDQMRSRIISAVKRLSAKQQEIIYLRFYCDLSYTEIAGVFDVNIQTGRNLMNRAINSLKEDLKINSFSKHLILFYLKLSV
jgi:RNA polymerase sigma factor (sigma-70 family)